MAALLATGAPLLPADDAGRRTAEPCGACHGPAGNSSIPTVPSLAGQPAIYLHWQLILFRDGRRRDPQMAPLAAALSDADMTELAAWYAAQKPVPPPRVPLTLAQADAGRALAERHFCFACHGAAFEGRDYAPRLSALHVDYLTARLQGRHARRPRWRHDHGRPAAERRGHRRPLTLHRRHGAAVTGQGFSTTFRQSSYLFTNMS